MDIETAVVCVNYFIIDVAKTEERRKRHKTPGTNYMHSDEVVTFLLLQKVTLQATFYIMTKLTTTMNSNRDNVNHNSLQNGNMSRGCQENS